MSLNTVINVGKRIQEILKTLNNQFFDWFDSEIYLSEAGDYTTNYDFNAIPNSITGTECWVDGSLGVNGDGTELNPFNNLSSALSGSFNIINIEAGRYDYTKAFNKSSINLQSRKFIGVNGQVELTTGLPTSSYSFSEEGTPNVYIATKGVIDTVGLVIDYTNIDSDGVYIPLTPVGSIAEVSANTNTFYLNGNDIYVRTFDDRAPTSESLGIMLSIRNVECTDLSTIYFKNCSILGGNTPVLLGNTDQNNKAKRAFDNCVFAYGRTKNNYYDLGNSTGYLKDCINSYALWGDGFNYDNYYGEVFEYNCKGNTYGSVIQIVANNGSTGHGGFKIIRLNCNYKKSYGNTVQDIELCKSLNINVEAGDVLIENGSTYPFANGGLDGETIMYFIDCRAVGNEGLGLRCLQEGLSYIYDGEAGNLLTKTNVEEDNGEIITLVEADVIETLPELSNFRVDNINPDRVLFDSNKIITSSGFNNFTVSNKTITGITINEGKLTGHYLTVSVAFADRVEETITYTTSSNIVDLFNQQVESFGGITIKAKFNVSSISSEYVYLPMDLTNIDASPATEIYDTFTTTPHDFTNIGGDIYPVLRSRREMLFLDTPQIIRSLETNWSNFFNKSFAISMFFKANKAAKSGINQYLFRLENGSSNRIRIVSIGNSQAYQILYTANGVQRNALSGSILANEATDILHLAANFDENGTIELYIDNTPITLSDNNLSTVDMSVFNSGTIPISIGEDFIGCISNFLISDTLFTADDIKFLGQLRKNTLE